METLIFILLHHSQQILTIRCLDVVVEIVSGSRAVEAENIRIAAQKFRILLRLVTQTGTECLDLNRCYCQTACTWSSVFFKCQLQSKKK